MTRARPAASYGLRSCIMVERSSCARVSTQLCATRIVAFVARIVVRVVSRHAVQGARLGASRQAVRQAGGSGKVSSKKGS